MNRKFVLISLVILIALFCFFLFGPVAFGIKKQITISGSIITVSRQVTELKNWPHWNEALKKQDGSLATLSGQNKSLLRYQDLEFAVLKDNPADITVKESSGNRKIYHSIFVFPDTNSALTHVVWIENLPLFSWMKEKMHSSGIVEKNLANLKNYIEDPKEYYGFDIRARNIIDTLEISDVVTTSKANRIAELAKLFAKMRSYSDKYNIGITDSTPRMANFYEINKDSVKILAAIPVHKKAAVENDISYFEMPPRGRMIFGYYEGGYSGIKALYRSMDNYMADKNLKPSAVPYERYLTNPKSAQDSLHMKIELCYPIF